MFGRHEVSPELRKRIKACTGVALVAFFALVARLWALQILDGAEMRDRSEHNRIRLRRVVANRGRVVDRFGRILVDSRASYDAVLVPEDAENLEATLKTLALYLHQTAAETRAVLARASGRRPFDEVVVRKDLDRRELIALETHRLELPGVRVRVAPRRSYPLGPVLAHVLGYVGEVGKADLGPGAPYAVGDLIGKAGVEKEWERELRGVNGGKQVEVDAAGRQLRVLDEVPPIPGRTLVLSIDLDLQRAAEEALGNAVGAVVALDPRNGEILAMTSHPSYDPNLFARGIRPPEWRRLLMSPHHPLSNRAIQGRYPPGSIFKIVVAAAALEQGAITPLTQLPCHGGVQFGNRYFRCWKKGGHGLLTLHEALVESCDSFFYQLAERLDIDTIANYARAFGLGRPTGIGLPGEKSGTVPDAAWKRRRFDDRWYLGETLPVAIGQGYLTVTPVQAAAMIATLATGVSYPLHLAKRVEAPDGTVLREFAPRRASRPPLREMTFARVRGALRDVVNGDRGTGKRARLAYVDVAGKTGTSQVARLGRKRRKPEELPWKKRDHAWFVAYAPAKDPQIAVAALVEHAGGGGGAVAAPRARKVLDSYFHLREQRLPRRYAKN